MLTRRALATGCASVLVACGCSSGSGKAEPTTTVRAPTSTRPAPSSTRAPVTTSTTTTIPGSLLEPLILKDAPSGFGRELDSVGDTGPTNLEKAVRDDALSDERDARLALKGAGFLRGYQRQWSAHNGVDQNFIYLYQFATTEGAQSYLSHWRDAALVSGTTRAPPVPFAPTNVPGAIGLQGRDERGSVGVVLLAKGPFAVQALVTGEPRIDQSLPASALALAQYVLLP